MLNTQVAMRCRIIPTVKQLRAAELMIVEGESAKAALLAVGYSQWTVRNPSQLIRDSKGLRAAVAIVMERTNHYIGQTPPPRRRRYDRRATARLVQTYVTPDSPNETSNKGTNAIYEQERKARAIVSGKSLPPAKPQRFLICPQCYARTEEKNMRYTMDNYVCSRCAGY